MMLSDAKLEANRRNAKKSTGPKSDEGKAKVSRNANKHGLFSGFNDLGGAYGSGWQGPRKSVVEDALTLSVS